MDIVDNSKLIAAIEELFRGGVVKLQKEIAEKTGYDETQISNYLANRVRASRPFISKFSTVFNLDPETLKLKTSEKLPAKAIPYLRDIDAIAGFNGAIMDVSEFIDEYISVPFFNKADYYVNVRGDSMYGRYRAGDIIAIKQVRDLTEIQYGQVFVVVTDENRVLKYVRKGKDDKTLSLVSENPKFDPYEVERKKVRAMFLVLGKITKDVL